MNEKMHGLRYCLAMGSGVDGGVKNCGVKRGQTASGRTTEHRAQGTGHIAGHIAGRVANSCTGVLVVGGGSVPSLHRLRSRAGPRAKPDQGVALSYAFMWFSFFSSSCCILATLCCALLRWLLADC
jgi:hypothetical protein